MSSDSFEEAFNILCGNLIAEGTYRKVFEYRDHDDLVVKVEKTDSRRSFSNVFEARNWEDYKGFKTVACWLAPCVRMSPDGLILIQKKVTPLKPEDIPTHIPAFLGDVKYQNFGWYNGQVVCCDYPWLNGALYMRLKRYKDHLLE